MKIAMAQMNPLVGDVAGNAGRIAAMAAEAHRRGADLVVFPEMAVLGYPPRDLLDRPAFVREARDAFLGLPRKLPPIPCVVGGVLPNPSRHGKLLVNVAAWMEAGELRHLQAKSLLPYYDVFDETRYFEPASATVACKSGGRVVGLAVCEDIWNEGACGPRPLYARDPVRELVDQGAQLVIDVSASPWQVGKEASRAAIVRDLAQRHKIPFLLCNQVGGNDELIFDGSSVAYAGDGRLLARGAFLAEDLCLFDPDAGFGDVRPAPADDVQAAYEALLLGIRDYFRKCGFRDAVIGLSGGIDSSLVACLAADALGPDRVTGIAMPGPYSAPESLADAEALARNLGMPFKVFPMTEAFEAYKKALPPIFEGGGGVAAENIQARVRGTFLMAWSNRFGALLLTTGNKSELACGYCTLYGDMAGGLAVIADVPKLMVYRLSEHADRRHGKAVIPARVFTRPPTAELRPNQKDSDTLPPYEILDPILKGYVEDGNTAEDLVRAGFDEPTVRRVIRMVELNEYKRRQMPPGLRITSKAFGMGRRIPIARHIPTA